MVGPSAPVFKLFFVPSRTYGADDLGKIELVGRRRSFQGIRMVPDKDPERWLIFWSFSCGEIIDALSEFGFEVERSESPINYFGRKLR